MLVNCLLIITITKEQQETSINILTIFNNEKTGIFRTKNTIPGCFIKIFPILRNCSLVINFTAHYNS